jgi:hypothetical protein
VAQPETVPCFTHWAGRVRVLDDLFTMRLGAVALERGFASGQDLREADSASLSPIATTDRAHVLREHRASTLAEGAALARALLAVAAQVVPRAGAAPGAVVPVARRLLDAFLARLP